MSIKAENIESQLTEKELLQRILIELRILNKYNEMIYHICYEVENIEMINKLFSNNRATCVSKPKPAILFDNRLVSFYYLPQVGLVEVLQK